MSTFNRPTLTVISMFCILSTLLISCWFSGAIALPIHVAQAEMSSEFPGNFFSYLDKKYTLYLGDARSACAYRIDPTEVYEQGNNRFVMAKISQGVGSGCRDVIDFVTLQADCQANKFYEIMREAISPEPGSSGPTRYRWLQSEMSLSEHSSNGSGVIRLTSGDLASKVCDLPTKSAATES
jgi:hypothetical protein